MSHISKHTSIRGHCPSTERLITKLHHYRTTDGRLHDAVSWLYWPQTTYFLKNKPLPPETSKHSHDWTKYFQALYHQSLVKQTAIHIKDQNSLTVGCSPQTQAHANRWLQKWKHYSYQQEFFLQVPILHISQRISAASSPLCFHGTPVKRNP